MPTSTLSASRFRSRLGGAATSEQLEAALFASKAEAVFGGGDALEVSVTPDRLDLLSEGGLALELEGALGLASGGVRRRKARPGKSALRIAVDASVAPLRPHIAGVVVRAPSGAPLDDGLLAEAVRFQELLHATVGRQRRTMSLGIYPARRLRTPVRYALEPLSSVTFVPLDGESPVGAEAFFRDHPMAQQYGAMGRSGDACLTLRDSAGKVLSLPPVLNDRTIGEARPGDRALLLESTGTRERAVREGLGLLLVVFVARGWSVAPVAVDGPGEARRTGEDVIADAPRELPAEVVRGVSGEELASAAVHGRLARARLSARRIRGGWRVAVPPWRPDLQAPVDLAEEVVLAGGLRAEDGVVPASAVRGHRRVETQFYWKVSELLLGLGFAQPVTPVLVSDDAAARLGGPSPIRLSNPVSREYAVVRDRLLLSHLDVLARNTRYGYPQRFGEVAPVVVRVAGSETGGATRMHASLIVAGEGAGFAEAAAHVDYLLRAFDVGSIREPAEFPGTIPGRAAKVHITGETVAELGELHPALLDTLGVPAPVAWAELDLSALAPMVVRRDSTK